MAHSLSMREYKLICLDRGGAIRYADIIDARNDDDAMAQARMLKQGTLLCEVWDQDRLVATLTAEDLKFFSADAVTEGTQAAYMS